MVEPEVQTGPLQQWARWDRDDNSLTISRPPELSHEQLQQMWSPFVNELLTDQTIQEINVRINREVQVIHSRAEAQRAEDRRRSEEEERRRREERERAEAERRRAEEERRRVEQEAKDKAEALLLRHLTAEQKEDLRTKDHFIVRVGDEIYRINRGTAGNVTELDANGRELRRFCIHPRENLPAADVMLAQKLLLETDRDRFHKTANVTELAPQTQRRAA